MALNFDIPDIRDSQQKAKVGGKARKPRRLGDIRLKDSLRDLSKHYTATLEKEEQEKGVEFYTLSEGKEKVSFYGEEVSIVGVCIRKKKIAAIYVEIEKEKRDALIAAIEKTEEQKEEAGNLTIFADTVTSIFITKAGKGENSVSVALMDSEDAKALSDAEAIAEEQRRQEKGMKGKIWEDWFNPVGRISQKKYIPRALMVGAPATFLFGLSIFYPELMEQEAFFAYLFLAIGTVCFISLISLAMRRMSDIGISHLFYWIFFGMLFLINQKGPEYLGGQLNTTRVVGGLFLWAVVLLACFKGQPKKNKYGPVPKE